MSRKKLLLFRQKSSCYIDQAAASEARCGCCASACSNSGCARALHLGPLRPAERLNRDIEPLDQHPPPTLVLRRQRGVDGAQLLLRGGAKHGHVRKPRDGRGGSALLWLTHWSLLSGFFSTGFPTEPPGRSGRILSTCESNQCIVMRCAIAVFWKKQQPLKLFLDH